MPALIARCPQDPTHRTFTTVATVMEEWLVDEHGDHQETVQPLEVVHPPDADNYWQCCECGTDATVERTS